MTLLKTSVGAMRPTATAERSRLIRATPEAIAQLFSDPANLSAVLPRVQRVEVLRRSPSGARVRTHMQMGPLGSMTAEGDVTWLPGSGFMFSAARPVAIESRWTLTPEAGGTRVTAAMAIDLSPMMGPLAAFIPAESVAAMIGPDLDAALAAAARRLERA
jgi:carbon monoxide dehydrogenase subunit G